MASTSSPKSFALRTPVLDHPGEITESVTDQDSSPAKDSDTNSKRSSIAAKYRSLGRLSVQFQSIREINNLQSDETQTEKDLNELLDFLQKMVLEQDTFLNVKRDVETSIQKAIHVLMDDAESNIHMIRLKLEPELHRLSDMILQEIQYYTTIKVNHSVTLAKLKGAINVIRNEAAVRAKLGRKASAAQLSVGQDVAGKFALQERLQKIELDYEVIVALREREVKERSKLLTVNAQLANEIDKLKNELAAEVEKNKQIYVEMESLQETCKNLRKRIKIETKSRIKDLSDGDLASPGSQARIEEATKLPAVSSFTESNSRPTLNVDKSWPSTRSKSVSPSNFIDQVSKTQVSSKYLFLSNPSSSSSSISPPPKTRDYLHRQRNLHSNYPTQLEPIQNIPTTPETDKMCPAGQPSPIRKPTAPALWTPTFLQKSRPDSYSLLTSPNQWLAQISQAYPLSPDVMQDVTSRLSKALEMFHQSKFVAWVQSTEYVLHTILKSRGDIKQEIPDQMAQILWIFLDLSEYYVASGSYESAWTIVKKADSILSNFHGLRNDELKYLTISQLAYILFRRKDYTKALLQLQKAYRSIADKNKLKLLETHSRMACLLIMLRDPEEASQHIEITERYLTSIDDGVLDLGACSKTNDSLGNPIKHLIKDDISSIVQFNKDLSKAMLAHVVESDACKESTEEIISGQMDSGEKTEETMNKGMDS